MTFIMVLNDGSTWTDLAGCQIVEIDYDLPDQAAIDSARVVATFADAGLPFTDAPLITLADDQVAVIGVDGVGPWLEVRTTDNIDFVGTVVVDLFNDKLVDANWFAKEGA